MFDINARGALPDPETDSRFYSGATAKRLVAFFIDVVLAFGLGLIAAVVLGVLTLGVVFLLAIPVMAAVDFLYRWAAIARWSATPGMAMLGLELRRRDGERLDAFDAFAHTGLYYILVATGVGQLVSIALMVISPMGRGVHDTLIGTALINRPG
jgi:uncharacterized RDD family membrane protein YckC